MTNCFIPLARRFDPELILVSAGYDTHWLDPLGSMTVTVAGYGMMTRKLVALANELPEAHGRIAFTLEGGYDLKRKPIGVLATFGAMLGDADTLTRSVHRVAARHRLIKSTWISCVRCMDWQRRIIRRWPFASNRNKNPHEDTPEGFCESFGTRELIEGAVTLARGQSGKPSQGW